MVTPSNTPSLTPNVVVQNPVVRKVANVVLGISALALPILGIVDAGIEGVQFVWLPVVTQIDLFLLGAFAITVTAPNVPTPAAVAKIEARRDGFGGDL